MLYKAVWKKRVVVQEEIIVEAKSEQEAITSSRCLSMKKSALRGEELEFGELISITPMIALAIDYEVDSEKFYRKLKSLFPEKSKVGQPMILLTPEEFKVLEKESPEWEGYFVLKEE